MQDLVVVLKKIYERDMDLLIIEEFLADRGFAQLFLDKLNLPSDYVVVKAAHSLADADGESDITFILQYPDKRVALLIEDKIDAVTMPKQSERYCKRGAAGMSNGEYDEYFIMLVAPADYHREHANDNNADYDRRICYEELREYLSKQAHIRAAFKTEMIDCAIKEKKAGYQVQEVPAVTEFWMHLRRFCKEHYPHLVIKGEDAPKGATAVWPEFRTSMTNLKVVYKSQKGYVDLEFPKYGNHEGDLKLKIKNHMTPPMQIWNTGKSASVRISDDKWKLDFSQDFYLHTDVLHEVLQAVSTLCDLASKLNYADLY